MKRARKKIVRKRIIQSTMSELNGNENMTEEWKILDLGLQLCIAYIRDVGN